MGHRPSKICTKMGSSGLFSTDRLGETGKASTLYKRPLIATSPEMPRSHVLAGRRLAGGQAWDV